MNRVCYFHECNEVRYLMKTIGINNMKNIKWLFAGLFALDYTRDRQGLFHHAFPGKPEK